jgi:hypothetical protein
MGISESRGENQLRIVELQYLFRYPRSEPFLRNLVVTAPDQPHIRSPFATGSTKIPLAADGAQEDETILMSGFFGHGDLRFVCLGSARTDESWKI